MKNSVGLWIIVGICLISIPIIDHVWITTLQIIEAIRTKKESINFDTGLYYYLVITIFWWFLLIEVFGNNVFMRRYKKWFGPTIVAWFFSTILIAILLPLYIDKLLEDSGYTACQNPNEISRISLGKKLEFFTKPCKKAQTK